MDLGSVYYCPKPHASGVGRGWSLQAPSYKQQATLDNGSGIV